MGVLNVRAAEEDVLVFGAWHDCKSGGGPSREEHCFRGEKTHVRLLPVSPAQKWSGLRQDPAPLASGTKSSPQSPEPGL